MDNNKFWQWFLENEDRIFNIEDDMISTFDAISIELKKINEDISVDFGPVGVDGVREIVVTAGGIRSAFPALVDLVDSAPAMKRWKVTKFRQREPTLLDVEFSGTEVKAENVHYAIVRDSAPTRLGILLFFENYREDQKAIFGNIGYLFLDQAIGEFDVETRVGVIELFDRSSKYFSNARPLAELGEHFDEVVINLEDVQ